MERERFEESLRDLTRAIHKSYDLQEGSSYRGSTNLLKNLRCVVLSLIADKKKGQVAPKLVNSWSVQERL